MVPSGGGDVDDARPILGGLRENQLEAVSWKYPMEAMLAHHTRVEDGSNVGRHR